MSTPQQQRGQIVLNKDKECPIVKCVYHKDQVVTNFCSSPECMHPLCPICVTQHIQDHKNYRDYAAFDTYEDVLAKANTEINDFLQILKTQKDKITILEQNFQGQDVALKKQINVAHNKAKVLLDDYFRTIEAELDAALTQQKEQFSEQKLKAYEQLQSRAEINVNYGLGLYNSEKSVRSLLTYLHNNVQDQNKKFLDQFKDIQDQKQVQVNTDSSKLHEIHVLLSKFVEVQLIPVPNLTTSSPTQNINTVQQNKIQQQNPNQSSQQYSYSQSINQQGYQQQQQQQQQYQQSPNQQPQFQQQQLQQQFQQNQQRIGSTSAFQSPVQSQIASQNPNQPQQVQSFSASQPIRPVQNIQNIPLQVKQGMGPQIIAPTNRVSRINHNPQSAIIYDLPSQQQLPISPQRRCISPAQYRHLSPQGRQPYIGGRPLSPQGHRNHSISAINYDQQPRNYVKYPPQHYDQDIYVKSYGQGLPPHTHQPQQNSHHQNQLPAYSPIEGQGSYHDYN